VNVSLARNAVPSRRVEWIRAITVAGLAIVLSGVWRLSFPILLHSLACSSIGNPYRDDLLAAELWRLYPSLYTHEKVKYRPSHWLDPDPWVTWRSSIGTRPFGCGDVATWFADADLRLRGCVWDGSPDPDSGLTDAEGDGRPELTVSFFFRTSRDLPRRDVRRWAILRLGESHNELLAAVSVQDVVSSFNSLLWLRGVWSNLDGEGSQEIVFGPARYERAKPGSVIRASTYKWAVLGWTQPGGVLRVIEVARPEKVLVWTPPDGQPLRVPANQPLEPLLDEVLPIPDEWLAALAQPDDTWGYPEPDAEGNDADASAWDEQDEESTEESREEPPE